MKILLAAPRGFCAGVNMAIESLDLAIAAFGTPIYVYHEIVHNKYVVDFLLFHWRDWHYPAFNVADSAITCGAAALIVDSFRQRRVEPAAGEDR